MAAQELDKLWDKSVDTLSDGFAATVDLLEAGVPKEALDAYRGKFLVTVKDLYSEASTTQPGRFEKIEDWSAWARGLYVESVKTDKALAALPEKGSADASASLAKLDSLRAQFVKLHQETGTQSSCDFIYALRMECKKDQPSAEALKKIQASLDKAPAAKKAAAKAAAYAAAKAEWDKAVTPLLAKGAIPADAVAGLREAAEKFYKAFGVQLE